MHELAVCQSLMAQVVDIAARENAERVTSITLRMGPLSGVEPDLLAEAFPIAAAGTPAEGAELRFERLPVRVRCTTCGAESDATVNRLLCGACGDYRTRLISGDEMLLASLELERRVSAG
ncbi:MAG: hydrogenase maturation nickel metallochaperone HypA [Gammaproteobacteria bacterium]|jgi:hydrogenase nickel incorporation protein HypA/HybF